MNKKGLAYAMSQVTPQNDIQQDRMGQLQKMAFGQKPDVSNGVYRSPEQMRGQQTNMYGQQGFGGRGFNPPMYSGGLGQWGRQQQIYNPYQGMQYGRQPQMGMGQYYMNQYNGGNRFSNPNINMNDDWSRMPNGFIASGQGFGQNQYGGYR